MKVESIATVLPVPDLDQAVRFWSEVLGTEPTLVDGDRWAQFDLGGQRLALAGSDRPSDQAGVMLKIEDLPEAERGLAFLGLSPGSVAEGDHEDRLSVASPGGWPLTIYSPKRS